jgi:hypothetical protein
MNFSWIQAGTALESYAGREISTEFGGLSKNSLAFAKVE